MSKTNELNPGQKLTIRQVTSFNPKDKSFPKLQVDAPLPSSFGFGTQLKAQEIFAGFIPSGPVVQLLNLAGKSTETGFLTRRLFTGVDTPDLNLELEFKAFDDAFKDVIIPVATMFVMGSAESTAVINDKLAKLVQKGIIVIEHGINTGSALIGGPSQPFDKSKQPSLQNIKALGRYIQAPPLVNVRFGNAFFAQNLYVSSVNVSFSSVLDDAFIPMAATLNLTLTFRDPLYTGSIVDGFAHSADAKRRKQMGTLNTINRLNRGSGG